MSLVKFEGEVPHEKALALTTESRESVKMQKGDKVQPIIQEITFYRLNNSMIVFPPTLRATDDPSLR